MSLTAFKRNATESLSKPIVRLFLQINFIIVTCLGKLLYGGSHSGGRRL